ncbi:hypothetical protein Taro_029657 [Colocasia esculenta]|uniref:Uncharacterized protein n=1 Tax=Colocasia esculenta TaxID=4460 RepID=A0A843VLY2_COLES|nr:hypothetical protein [Colocasia esculenta]
MAGRREATMRLWRRAGEESGSDGIRGSWMGGVLFHHAPKSLHLPVAWVAKEALRLHPPTPLMLPHRANADVKLAGYDVPKGSNVLVNVCAIARNPAVWKDPLEFRPERFADEDVDMKGHDFRLLSFGAGRRVCPGAQLGINMVQSMLGHLLHQFRWERRSRVDLFIAYPSINPLCEEIGV